MKNNITKFSTVWFATDFQEDVQGMATEKIFAVNDMLMMGDDDTRHTYIVVNGRVRMWALLDAYVSDNAQEIYLDDVNAVDMVGELAAIDGKPQNIRIEALTDVSAWRIKVEDFSHLIEKHDVLKKYILFNLCQRLKESNDRVRDALVLSAGNRVRREIVRLAEIHCPEGISTGTIQDFPQHTLIAARCGVTRETVSRTIGFLIKEGLLKRKGKSMHVCNMKELMTCFIEQRQERLS